MIDRKWIRGIFLHTPTAKAFDVRYNQWLEIEQGIIRSFHDTLPEANTSDAQIDYSDKLIIPAFCDMHVHAPQYPQIGIGMDMELMEWLSAHTFPQEAAYANTIFARAAYQSFAAAMLQNGTFSCSVYGTIHTDSTIILAEELKKAGIRAWVGKVNMDRNAPPSLLETTDFSLSETYRFLASPIWDDRIRPILTPRFAISCSMPLMRGLAELAAERNIPVQSHLSENVEELIAVSELFPKSGPYWRVYDEAGLFGTTKTLMAHCVHIGYDARAVMKQRGIAVIHCPSSNTNLSSGVMDTSGMLDEGITVALGSDVGAGNPLSMARNMIGAIQVSKLRKYFMPEERQLTLPESFYLATKAGGDLFGGTGSFENGRSFDALVIDDALLRKGQHTMPTPENRIAHWAYSGDDRQFCQRFIAGKPLTEVAYSLL